MKGITCEQTPSIIAAVQASGFSVPEYLRRNPECPLKRGAIYKYLNQKQVHGACLPDGRSAGKARRKRIMEPMAEAVIWVILMECNASPLSALKLIQTLIVQGPSSWKQFKLMGLRSIEELAHRFRSAQKSACGFPDNEHLALARKLVALALNLAPSQPDDLWQGDAFEATPTKLKRLGVDAILDGKKTVTYHVFHLLDAHSGFLFPQQHTFGYRTDKWDVAMALHRAVVPVSMAHSKATGKPTILRLDRGGECRGFFRLDIARKLGIQVQFTPRNTPCLNGRVERVHRTIWAILRVLLKANQQMLVIANGIRTIDAEDFETLMDRAREVYNGRARRRQRMSPQDVYAAKPLRSRAAIDFDASRFCIEHRFRVAIDGTVRLGYRRYHVHGSLTHRKVNISARIFTNGLEVALLDRNLQPTNLIYAV